MPRRVTKPLTRQRIRAAKPQASAYEIRCAAVPGFMVRIHPSGIKTYQFRRGGGKRYTIGSANDGGVTLTMARNEAMRLRAHPEFDEAWEKKPDRLTLGEFFESVYQPAELAGRDSTAQRFHKVWGRLNKKPLDEITAELAEKIQSEERARGLSDSTLNRDSTILKRVLSFAVEKSHLAANPLDRKLFIKKVDDMRPPREGLAGVYLSDTERARFLAALGNQSGHVQTAVRVAYWTGMRRGEIFGLQWRDVDLDQRRLRVKATKTDSWRWLGAHRELVAALRLWGERPERGRSVYVVPSPVTWERLDNINRAWASLCRDADISDFRFHDLRHDFASRLVMNGTPLYTVAKILGHTTERMAARYAHLSPESELGVIDEL